MLKLSCTSYLRYPALPLLPQKSGLTIGLASFASKSGLLFCTRWSASDKVGRAWGPAEHHEHRQLLARPLAVVPAAPPSGGLPARRPVDTVPRVYSRLRSVLPLYCLHKGRRSLRCTVHGQHFSHAGDVQDKTCATQPVLHWWGHTFACQAQG